MAPDIPDNDNDSRDRPLTFHWSVNHERIRALGVNETGDRRFDASLRAILTEAVLAHETDQWVSYSRRKAFYAGLDRYHGTAYTYANVLGGVAEGVRLGLLEETRALPGDHLRTGLQSAFKATTKLVEGYRGAELEYELRGLIRLRDEFGDLIGFRDTRETRRMVCELERINDVLAGVVLDLTAPNVTRNGRHLVINRDDKIQHILPTTPALYRVFSRGSFGKGGRLIGWWQSLPKDIRAALTINGEPVAEPDFAAMHANLLYGMRGLALEGDPYVTGDFSRAEGKLAFNIGLNAPTPQSAIGAIAEQLRVERRYAAKLFKAIKARHREVDDAFGSDMGVKLMRVESDITLGAVKLCTEAGIPVAPVHDSMICPAKNSGDVVDFMQRSAAKRLGSNRLNVTVSDVSKPRIKIGAINHCHVTIKRQKVPHMGREVSGVGACVRFGGGAGGGVLAPGPVVLDAVRADGATDYPARPRVCASSSEDVSDPPRPVSAGDVALGDPGSCAVPQALPCRPSSEVSDVVSINVVVLPFEPGPDGHGAGRTSGRHSATGSMRGAVDALGVSHAAHYRHRHAGNARGTPRGAVDPPRRASLAALALRRRARACHATAQEQERQRVRDRHRPDRQVSSRRAKTFDLASTSTN